MEYFDAFPRAYAGSTDNNAAGAGQMAISLAVRYILSRTVCMLRHEPLSHYMLCDKKCLCTCAVIISAKHMRREMRLLASRRRQVNPWPWRHILQEICLIDSFQQQLLSLSAMYTRGFWWKL